ncbi:20521_t:CDS:2 [Dentiscutata erythropus]|uniref:20521_t:CDS:1 n=1 Tax=Dentiscutata erythropus TaxID=1348616 RepID=A0A9N9EMW8_9GLOM|nr:20521_t:CDS:2 [Dentiscutata erythropus]
MLIRSRIICQWESFSISRLIRLDPCSLFTYSFALSLITQLGNDVIIYYIRNQEIDTNSTISDNSQQFMTKPESTWSSLDLQLNMVACYLSAISISFIITSLLALQAYWNYLMEQLSRRQFISTWEYWTYLVLAILLIPVFPILAAVFSILKSDTSYQVDLPQLISSSLTFIIFLLGLRTQFGISKLIKTPTRNISQNQGKLKYFQDLNVWLIMSLFLWSISYVLLVIDKLFISQQFLGNSRFLIDFLSVNANFGRLFAYITLILIVYPDFSIDSSSSPKRQISKPMNFIKHDTPNLDELIYQCHTSVDSSTTSEKQSSTKLSKKNSKKLPLKKSINDDVLPISPVSQSSLIDEALQQQIVVELTRERTVEPAYMHAYINPHVPHRNNLQSPTPSNRPFSINSDLLAPLPSPNSDFGGINSRARNNSNQGRSLFFQNNSHQKIAPDSEEIINGTRSDQNNMNRINQGQNFVSINVNEQNDSQDVKRDQRNQKDRIHLVIDTNVRNNIGKQSNNEFLNPSMKYKNSFI